MFNYTDVIFPWENIIQEIFHKINFFTALIVDSLRQVCNSLLFTDTQGLKFDCEMFFNIQYLIGNIYHDEKIVKKTFFDFLESIFVSN